MTYFDGIQYSLILANAKSGIQFSLQRKSTNIEILFKQFNQFQILYTESKIFFDHFKLTR